VQETRDSALDCLLVMDLSALRECCLSKPGATESRPFGPGVSVMKVGGRIFAIVPEQAEPPTISLKCEPDIAIALRNAYEAVRPGYHLNKRHWNTVTLDGTLADRRVREWIEDSYDLVVNGLPRRLRDEITAGNSPQRGPQGRGGESSLPSSGLDPSS
jgi:predicted DNA-binding protein (MmcQ/YjbR family)